MRFTSLTCCLVILLSITPCLAADGTKSDRDPSNGILMLQASPTVIHFNSDPEHVDYSWLVGVEWQLPSRWLTGYSYFNNSFGQKSQYIYAGYWWPISEKDPNWYVKLTGGVILGYKEPYEDKIPYNNNGVAPGIVPGLGYKWNRFNAQLNLLGTAGLMITVGYDLIR
jgi:hypothetical protein